MSVAVCRAALLQPVSPLTSSSLPKTVKSTELDEKEETKKKFEIWNSIQIPINKDNNITSPNPYIHPLVHRSSILMNQKSLETCTESLGSETGSEEFSSGDEFDFSSFKTYNEDQEAEQEAELHCNEIEKRDLFNVNYHCSIGHRSPLRSFPPPLPSIAGRDGPCFAMRPRRLDGRLIVEAVPVPPVNYLHAERRGGRLLLSFIEISQPKASPVLTTTEKSHNNNEEYEETMKEVEEEDEELEVIVEEEEEEEEVEVVNRGAIVEVKVSSNQTKVKIRRSSLVINKFVVGSGNADFAGKRTFFTAAAAPPSNAAEFKLNYLLERHVSRWGPQPPEKSESKLLLTWKRRSREELLRDMRRCSELRQPLFIFEKNCCIATS